MWNVPGGEGREPSPAVSGGERGRQVASVVRFVLGDERGAQEFEDELARQVRAWNLAKGLANQVVLQSLDRPGGYVHLAFWQSSEHLFGAVHSDAVCARLDRLGELAAVEPGQAVAVGLLGDGPAVAGAAHALLVRVTLSGPAAAFEAQFGALAGQFLNDPGCGGCLLLRYTVEPRAYLGLIWWDSAASCEAATRGDRFLEGERHLRHLASGLAFERVRTVGGRS
ncbi:antibiotic biosynthesis monooxygenase family protein [Streptomyces monomycini]|uniref:antibiotic biosynthesis monooxygenase family protein n=1 Tax=Streptomyces monomycini TaxID=371720 RepID=UPI0004AB37DA|nr:antibiotic biosynthesis monooxygenase [Streptomyces monomycini]